MRRSLLVSFVAVLTGVLVTTIVLVVASAGAALHSAHHGHHGHHGGRREDELFRAELAPSVPTDPMIFGVSPGGAPWQLDHGKVRIGEDGTFEVEVDGLVLTTTGSNPVPDIAASVFCNGTLAATTLPVPFSTSGDAHIQTTVSLPAFCPAPAVLLNPATGSSSSNVVTSLYIGFDGTT